MLKDYKKNKIYYYPVVIHNNSQLLLTTVKSEYDKSEVNDNEPNMFYSSDVAIIWPHYEHLDDRVIRKSFIEDFYPNLSLAIRRCIEIIFEDLLR